MLNVPAPELTLDEKKHLLQELSILRSMLLQLLEMLNRVV